MMVDLINKLYIKWFMYKFQRKRIVEICTKTLHTLYWWNKNAIDNYPVNISLELNYLKEIKYLNVDNSEIKYIKREFTKYKRNIYNISYDTDVNILKTINILEIIIKQHN